MKVRHRLKGCTNLQEHILAERRRNDLQSNGQLLACKPTGHRERWQARQVHRNGEDIREVHLQRVSEALPETKRRGRRDRRQQGVTLRKGALKILPEERTQLLCLFVIGVVIASA